MCKNKAKKTAPSDDEIRELILTELYTVHENARGLTSSRLSISELKKILMKHNLHAKDVVSNLDYLIQSGWIKVETENYEFTTPKGFTRKQEKKYYKISDVGINYFQGVSKFQKVGEKYEGINITTINGVTVLGNGNIAVNTQFIDLYKHLSILSEIIAKSSQLSDEEKLNNVGEIETIKAQLMKTNPDKSIIRKAWDKLKPLATIAGIASFFQKVVSLIGALL
ncbi:MAG: hypothetical protein IAX21_03620 [Candidatus Bathyarchaeota archaeon]|nr:MAG: hypothetical protein IAX21_03620 [Candidatus Bathyarchaeota archaeon]